ncbi:hypothetical protein SLJ91_01275 [Acinetobacter pittii]|uniref:hypothetical protein n=1 Tax=Acinetobacter pittii TaxID=48296 RepID=UPI00205C94B7|nr:hypothetical protein [Acinetobacter pittii]MDX8202053.1 hypothetical protein [Acinetobacter pittii]MDX8227761.1 hypothetical protein [Acinetobacter pittii]WPP79881.1 hypothetical protein SOI79_13495 [Acinetobacter pittii]DAI74943.1 MAG TPA: hypothetical protein [Caudoviricetes sp.]
MNILNNQQAFEALQNGKKLLCRQIEGEFAPLDRFPATVFALPGYEFCIDIEKIELAGITFTKPITIDEYVEGQDVFVINAYPALIYVLDFKTNALIESINSGFVQRDAENAKLQLNAFSKALGFEINNDLSVIRLGEEPKKQRGKKSKTEQPQVIEKPSVDPQLLEAEKDIVLDGINNSKTECEIDSLCYDLEKHSFTPEQLKAIENAKDAKLAELALIRAEAESEKHELFDSAEDQAQAPELSVLCEAFIDEIAKSNSKEDLDFIRSRINSNGVLTEVENAELCTRINIKAKTFEKTDEEESNYQEKLAELKKHVDEAKTPAEVNAAVKYTNSWSAEQRAPLLKHMHERLEDLKKEKQASEPSMFVKIQTAPDLTTLDALEIDVSSLDPVVQPDILKAVKARRDFLEHKAIDESSIDGDLP